jgi:dephospho-CoA kinase
VILGLTGGYCSGKNRVASLLGDRGWTSIDVDRLGHEALLRSRDAVLARFDAEARGRLGRSLLDAAGAIDRKTLGALVFSDPRALADHEAIVHPAMFALLDEGLAEADAKARTEGLEPRLVVNAAILYKMPVARRCDAIIEVRAPLLARLARARARDGLGALAALARIRRQAPLWPLARALGVPVLRLGNRGDVEGLDRRLRGLLAGLSLRR